MKCIVENCENERMRGRRYCEQHFKEIHRQQAITRYNSPNFKRITYPGVCEFCGKEFRGLRNHQLFCSVECYKKFRAFTSNSVTNNYACAKGGGYCFEHRRFAEEVLNRQLDTNEVVHHIDLNPKKTIVWIT